MNMITVYLRNYNFLSVTLTLRRRASYAVFFAFYSRKGHKLLVLVSRVLRRVEYRGEESTEESRVLRRVRY